jgi:ketosteroid isomerase-like protein
VADQQSNGITTADGVAAVKEFFTRLSNNCAAVDFDSTEKMFAPDVASFGTKAQVVVGLAPLRDQQWEWIWPNIQDFEMKLDEIHSSSSGDLAWGMVPWVSTGFDESGAPYDRPGRATIVMERRGGEWLATHSHFSLVPGTPPRTFGPDGKGGKDVRG